MNLFQRNKKTVRIRKQFWIDPQLYAQIKAHLIYKGKSFSEWLTAQIKEELKKG